MLFAKEFTKKNIDELDVKIGDTVILEWCSLGEYKYVVTDKDFVGTGMYSDELAFGTSTFEEAIDELIDSVHHDEIYSIHVKRSN